MIPEGYLGAYDKLRKVISSRICGQSGTALNHGESNVKFKL
jgi:hypothetical protein